MIGHRVQGGAASENTLQQVLAALGGGDSSDTNNTTTATLGAGGVYTGVFTDVTNFKELVILCFADQDSAANGLQIDWSTDGVNVDYSENFDVLASTGKSVRLAIKGEYYRIVYTNGAGVQGAFRLEAIIKSGPGSVDFREVEDAIDDKTMAAITKAVLSGEDSLGAYRNVGVTDDNHLFSRPNGGIADNAQDTGANAGNPIKMGAIFEAALPTYDDGDRSTLHTNASGELLTEPDGNVADNAADSGNPLKVGAVYEAALPTYDDGDRSTLHTNANGELLTEPDGNVADNAADSGNPLKVGAVYEAALPTYDDGDRSTLHTNASGELLTEPDGNVAHDAADSGNPIKVGGVYNLADPTLDDGDRGDLQLDSAGNLKISATGNVAHDAADSGNPLKVGGIYRAALDTLDDGDRSDLHTDVNGRLLTQASGDVADNAADSGNPVKVGAKYNDTQPTYADGDRADLQAASSGQLVQTQKRIRVDAPVRNDHSGTAITTAAYTQLVASTSADIHRMHIFDSSGEALYFAIGAAAAEVDQFVIEPGGNGIVDFFVPSGSRISVKAITANTSEGDLLISFLS